jgi:hypothetical protein
LELVEYGTVKICKQWLYQLKNCFKNMLKNIIWQLFAGESHQVVKITVTYKLMLQKRKAEESEEGELGDPDMMAMMGFSGFGSSSSGKR